jgi:hypothetical protein
MGMVASGSCKIFVNGLPVDGLHGEGVIDAIQRWDAALANQLRGGRRTLADSRGLSATLETPIYGGAIFRVVSSRQLQADEDPLADA